MGREPKFHNWGMALLLLAVGLTLLHYQLGQGWLRSENIPLLAAGEVVDALSVYGADGKGSAIEFATNQAPEAVLEFVRILRTTILSVRKSTTDHEINLASVGLSPPLLSVDLKQPNRIKRVHLGSRNELLNVRYLQIEGQNRVYMVSEDVFQAALALLSSPVAASPPVVEIRE